MNKALFLIATCIVQSLTAETNAVKSAIADLGTIKVEALALSRYRAEQVLGGTFTDTASEKLPCVVDALTGDFIRERRPTDLNDLLRWVPGVETGGTSLLVRQPGLFSVRGMGGTEPAFDGIFSVGRGAGLFMDPALMDRIEIVKGPIASLSGGAGAQQNNNGAGGAINLYLKGANFNASERTIEENTIIGRNLWRQRVMFDANEIFAGDQFALRAAGVMDLYSPAYIAKGSQEGARPRQSYSFAPSMAWRPRENITVSLKTMFTAVDQPSYIGVPVWRGRPAGGFDWYESSARKGDRSKYMGMLINPNVDWQVNDRWLLKFGGSFMYSDMEQTTREPYVGNGKELARFYATGKWTSHQKYMTSSFSQSHFYNRNFNLYTRSVWSLEDLPGGFSNVLMVQPDFLYRDSTTSFGTPTARYGMTLQDSIDWEWVTLIGGIRYDYFVEKTTEYAFSPRGGLVVQPLEWLVFFANLSQTRTPTLGYRESDGSRPSDPWVATQEEAGVRVRPLERLWFSAGIFNIDQENTPVAETVGKDIFYRFEGHARSRGAELSLTGDITDDWTIMAKYAFTKYKDLQAKGKAASFERTPRHTFTLSTSYRLHGWDPIEDVVIGGSYRMRTKSYATMRGNYVNENLYFNPSHVFDLTMSVPMSKFGLNENWLLTLGIKNIFGEKYFETSRHFYESFVGEPRTFEIGLRGKF